MCQRLIIDDGPDEIDCIGELEVLAPRDSWVVAPGYGACSTDRAVCLCSIDLVETGRALGYTIETDEWGVMWASRKS